MLKPLAPMLVPESARGGELDPAECGLPPMMVHEHCAVVAEALAVGGGEATVPRT